VPIIRTIDGGLFIAGNLSLVYGKNKHMRFF